MSAGSSARKLLSGMFSFLNCGCDWNIQIVSPQGDFTPKFIRAACEDGCAGMIVTKFTSAEAEHELLNTKLPLVIIDADHIAHERPNTTLVLNNNEGVGKAAFRYLHALGRRRTYAFVPTLPALSWSTAREASFRQCVLAQNLSYTNYGCVDAADLSSDHQHLRDWLWSLPKPAAVMADWDYRAAQIVNACNEMGIRIPDDVAVIGVDNDELFCNSTKPAITSVRQNMELCGYRAATEMDVLLKRRKNRGFKQVLIDVPPNEIVERDSTKFTSQGNALINRALDFIGAHSSTQLKVDDVARHLGTSRRILEMHFKNILGRTIHSIIAAQRISYALKLIHDTTRPFAKIARELGFSSLSNFAHWTQRQTGLSLRELRSRGGGGRVPGVTSRRGGVRSTCQRRGARACVRQLGKWGLPHFQKAQSPVRR
ncbi:MAG: substrate-binding domain-containing protein [Kiritimatiellia bacterium]